MLKSARAACDLEIVRQAQDVSALAERLASAQSDAEALRARVRELEALRAEAGRLAEEDAAVLVFLVCFYCVASVLLDVVVLESRRI